LHKELEAFASTAKRREAHWTFIVTAGKGQVKKTTTQM